MLFCQGALGSKMLVNDLLFYYLLAIDDVKAALCVVHPLAVEVENALDSFLCVADLLDGYGHLFGRSLLALDEVDVASVAVVDDDVDIA